MNKAASNPFEDRLWIPVRNDGSTAVPPHGVMRITGADQEEAVLTVAEPSGDSQVNVLVNGLNAIPAGAYGAGTRTEPVEVLYETSDGTATGDYGTVSGSWKLRKGKTGFSHLGAGTGSTAWFAFMGPGFSAGGGTVVDAAFGVAGKINTADQVWGSGDKAAPEDFIVGWSTAGDHTLSFSEDTAFTGHLTKLHAYGTAATQRALEVRTGVTDNELILLMVAGPSGGNTAYFQFGADGADATFPPQIRIQSDAFGSVVSGDTTTVAGLQFTSGWLTGGAFTGYAPGGTDVALADGGTGASLADPNADRILFWDDSAGAVTWLEAGSGLSIAGTTITATGSGLPADPGADRILVWDDSDGAAEWWGLGADGGLHFDGATLHWSANLFADLTDPLSGSDTFVVFDLTTTTTLKAEISDIFTYVVNNLTAANIPAFNGLTNATPADADRFPFYDDGVGNRDCSGSELKTYVLTGFVRDYTLLQDQKAQNTEGGTFTSGSWQTRTLNTEVTDTGGNCSLSSNQFTLSAGTYEILAIAPAALVNRHQIRLQNVTAGTTLLTGKPSISGATDNTQTDSILVGRFTVAASQALEIQHQCQTTYGVSGFGLAANFTTEVYTVVVLRRVA
jgi:hypothetical protein